MSIGSSQKRITWDRTKVIGQGKFGTSVYKGKFKKFTVAVKRVMIGGFINVDQYFIHIHLIGLKHQNIVQYFALESDQDFWFASYCQS